MPSKASVTSVGTTMRRSILHAISRKFADRATRRSSAVEYAAAPYRSLTSWAEPMWSKCPWVQKTPTGRSSRASDLAQHGLGVEARVHDDALAGTEVEQT